MSYSYSSLDNKLKKWFKSDLTCMTLHGIQLVGGLRSLKDIEVDFEFPITAFAGKNGSGKTTMLALAACAYHNSPKGHKVKSGKRTYYTFSDFFIQTSEEITPDGITIKNRFLTDAWSNIPPGLGNQYMKKRKGGKWASYEKRVEKNVIYLGIDRVVPQNEKQVYKTYKKYFRDGIDDGWYNDVQILVGRILGKNYSEFKIKKAGTYNLQLVKERDITYSGFNMGAGEKALFELFSIIHECSRFEKHTLIIIDEIELGLHEVAQRNLIEALKELSLKYRIQFICTTHSPAILESLPPEARYYIEKVEDESIVTCGISGAYATGRLAEKNSNELDILVEDNSAENLLTSCIKLDIRQRVNILPIGSCTAVCRQLASAYRNRKLKESTIAILDGDQKVNLSKYISNMMLELELATDAEKTKFKTWVSNKIFFLPGDSSPEKWIVKECVELINHSNASFIGVSVKDLKQELKNAQSQPTHDIFYFLSKKLMLSADSILTHLTRILSTASIPSLVKLVDDIENKLD